MAKKTQNTNDDIITLDGAIDNISETFEVEPTKKSWIRNSNPVIMSVREDDPERQKLKADLFNRLYELKNRQGIPKFHNTEEMEIVIDTYFYNCADLGLRPTVRGLASALGTIFSTLNGWEAGDRDKILGSNCSAIIKKAKQFIAEFDEQAALDNIDNPILFMFRAKNYYGMADKQEISISPHNQSENAPSMEELAKRIPQRIVKHED